MSRYRRELGDRLLAMRLAAAGRVRPTSRKQT